MSIASEHVLYAGCLPATPFRELVDAVATAGFDALTLWPLMYRRAISREGLDPATMRQMLEDAGLRVTDLDPCGDWLPTTQDEHVPGLFRSVWTRHDFFDAAQRIGADTLTAVHLGGTAEVDHEIAVEGFATLCDNAADHGLRVALEFMPFSGIPDLAAGWRIVADAGRRNGGLILDVCHLTRGGWDEATLRAIPAERILAVQLSDGPAPPADDLREESMYHRLLPGAGDFNVARVVGILADMRVRTRVGPELYRRSWSERPAATVASDLAAATRGVVRD